MGLITNSAEGGTHGVVVTSGNSGGASGTAWSTVVDGPSNTTVKFDSAATMFGSLGYTFVTTGTAEDCFVAWIDPLTPSLTMYARTYCKFTNLPGAVYRIMMLTNSSYGGCGGVGINSSDKFVLRNRSGSTVLTSTLDVPTDAWFRLELMVFSDAAVGQIELKIFLDPYSTIPDETMTTPANVNTRGGDIQGAVFGADVDVANLTMHMDEMAVQETGYIGPAAAHRIPWLSA